MNAPTERYLRTLLAIEREAVLNDDTPAWLVGLLGAVDPAELAELVGDRCPACGRDTHSVHVDNLAGDPAQEAIDTAKAMLEAQGFPIADAALGPVERRLLEELRTIG